MSASAADMIVGAKALASALNLRERTALRLIAAGRIPAMKKSGRWLVERRVVELFNERLRARKQRHAAQS